MKPGRKTLEPKDVQFKVRVTEDDMAMINYCSKTTHKSKSEIVRQLIREEYQKVKEKE